MATLSITARGQITLRKSLLEHIGVRPGERIEAEMLPDGRIALRALPATGKIDSFIGKLAGRTKKTATLEEIRTAAAEGWSAKR